ncbi:hypothetical protein J1614_007334 [Plenodomus biglobosus]|nr:hypothetical protein J1614_007334 [Plenodomus biglobosus]
MEDPPPVQHPDTTPDASTSFPITTTYTNGANIISLPTTYPLIKKLLAYPPCTHRDLSESHWPCSTCETAFTTGFWEATGTLLDYFADFFPNDHPTMQSLWFHLLDMWQSAALWLPYDHVLSEAADTPQTRRRTRHTGRAAQFKQDYELARKLFETIIYGPKKMARSSVKLSEDIIHTPDGVINGPTPVQHETGPWISGLKPWQQWLSAGSPGVAAPTPAGAKQDGARIRHVPMAAIAIIQQHNERARDWAAKLASRDPDTAPEKMARFDAHALVFPTTGKSAEYTALGGRKVRYTLVNGAPPVSRVPGLLDEDMKMEYPILTLVDECVGMCRGERAYVAQSGVPEEMEGEGEEGDEEEGEGEGEAGDEDEEEEEEEEVVEEDLMDGWFDTWTVVESGESSGQKSRFAEELEEVYDEWGSGERAQRIHRDMAWPNA